MLNPLRIAALFCSASLFAAEVPSPALLVLNKADSNLVIVDPSTGKIAGRVATGQGPHEITVSPDGRQAYVGNYGGGSAPGHTLSVIDIASIKELRRVDLAPMERPHGMHTSEGKVWFTAESNKLIGRYDPAANRVDTLLGTGQNRTHMVLLSNDNRVIYTANIDSDSISVFNRAQGGSEWIQTVIPVGKGPEGLDLTPDGRELWTSHSRDGGVSIIDTASRKVIGQMDIGTKRSNRIKLTVDGKYALVSDMGGGELIVIDAPARKVVKRLAIGRSPEGILMDPAGARAFVAVSGDNHVAVLDLKSLSVTSKIETGNGPDGMAWAPKR